MTSCESTGWLVIMIVSWAIENYLVYFEVFSGRVCDCDSFLGYWGIKEFIFGVILIGAMIVIVFWSYPLVGL